MINKLRFLNSNSLKIIAAITMLIDHTGMILFPTSLIFRMIGRISFPIFAFMISEGAKYTRNRLRYLLTILILGILFQLPMVVLFNNYEWNIFVTFALSISLIYLLDWFKISFFKKECRNSIKAISFIVFISACLGLLLIPKLIPLQYAYGFHGCMLAVFASAPTLDKTDAPEGLKRLDCLPVRVFCMLIPLLIYCHVSYIIQYFSVVAVIPLLLYSGKKGKANMKYFFYVFYPAHLVVLFGIAVLYHYLIK